MVNMYRTVVSCLPKLNQIHYGVLSIATLLNKQKQILFKNYVCSFGFLSHHRIKKFYFNLFNVNFCNVCETFFSVLTQKMVITVEFGMKKIYATLVNFVLLLLKERIIYNTCVFGIIFEAVSSAT